MKKHLIPSLFACAALTLGAATLPAQAPSLDAGGSPAPGAPPPPPPHGRHGPPPSALFRALDTNGDGIISADEIANAPTTLKALAGESGQITHESLRPARREDGSDERRSEADAPLRHPQPNDDATRPHRPRPDADHGPRQADASPTPGSSSDDRGGHRHGPPHGDGLFRVLDTNGDGIISADEMAAAATALKKADTNGDGVIDHRDFGPPPPPAPAN